jgi:hypothetical protein
LNYNIPSIFLLGITLSIKIFETQTFKPGGIRSLPIWRSLLALPTLILVWMLIAELVARTSLGYHLPPPSVGADSFEFDTKIYYLEQSIRQHGPLDCLLVGDSMTNDGPDPRLIEAAYETKTGSPLHCFNFGLPALFLDGSGPLADVLEKRYHPKLLILILSARDFETSVDFPVRYVAFSDWAQQNVGKPSLRGWAVNSSYGYRYSLSLQYLLTSSNRIKFVDTWHTFTKDGFAPLNGFGQPRDITPPGPKFQRSNPAAQTGFDQLLQLHHEGVNLLIIDAPIRPDFYMAYHDNYFQPYVEYMQKTLAEQAVPFWLTKDLSNAMPSDGWYDLQHFNEKGVPLFGTWLGNQLAQAYPPEFFK